MSWAVSCSTDSGVRNPSTATTFVADGAGGGGGTGGATGGVAGAGAAAAVESAGGGGGERFSTQPATARAAHRDRKSTRLNSSHGYISYAVFCLKKKKKTQKTMQSAQQTSTASGARKSRTQ